MHPSSLVLWVSERQNPTAILEGELCWLTDMSSISIHDDPHGLWQEDLALSEFQQKKTKGHSWSGTI